MPYWVSSRDDETAFALSLSLGRHMPDAVVMLRFSQKHIASVSTAVALAIKASQPSFSVTQAGTICTGEFFFILFGFI